MGTDDVQDVMVEIYFKVRQSGPSFALVDSNKVTSNGSVYRADKFTDVDLDIGLNGKRIADHVTEMYEGQFRIVFLNPPLSHELDLIAKIWKEFCSETDGIEVIWRRDGESVIPEIGLPITVARELLASSIEQITKGNPCLEIPDKYLDAVQTYFSELAYAKEISPGHQPMDPEMKSDLPEPIQNVVTQVDGLELEIGEELKASIAEVVTNLAEAGNLNQVVRPRMIALAGGPPELVSEDLIETVPTPWREDVRKSIQSR